MVQATVEMEAATAVVEAVVVEAIAEAVEAAMVVAVVDVMVEAAALAVVVEVVEVDMVEVVMVVAAVVVTTVVVVVEVAGGVTEVEEALHGTSTWAAKELQVASIEATKNISTLHPQPVIATEPCSLKEDKVVVHEVEVAIMAT